MIRRWLWRFEVGLVALLVTVPWIVMIWSWAPQAINWLTSTE